MAMVQACLARLVYAATGPKTGVFDLPGDARHNHRVDVTADVLAREASTRLSNVRPCRMWQDNGASVSAMHASA